MSQSALEEASGVPAPTIRGFEQGRREPTFATLTKLARGLGVSLSAFEPPEEGGKPAGKKPRKGK
jgi:transcriptional regulator with XRE-family HTH domain